MMYWNKPILRLDLQDYKIDTIEIGDKLVTVNGVPWTWQGKNIWFSVGSNISYCLIWNLKKATSIQCQVLTQFM
ncbi:MAG: hypothetical protein IPO37_21940 [Saprospiraceae bacterium]|nr:hypothetical protein [Saprospiraceae bacterium]